MSKNTEQNIREVLAATGCRDVSNLVDMATVGCSLLESISSITREDGPFKGWVPAQDPAEIVFDLANALGDARASAINEFLASEPVFQILGLMNFQTGPIAHVFQQTGETIRTKCEHEQAWVLRWMLGLAAEHGESWREKVSEEIDRRVALIKGAKAAKAPTP